MTQLKPLSTIDRRPSALLMGILNVTPDSFYDGGKHYHIDAAIAQGRQMIGEGADIIDIGGESTRPGAQPIDPLTELERVIPVIHALRGEKATLSIDTRNAKVMDAAVKAGATMINDITALSGDPGSLGIAADSGIPVILMHMQGRPENMQQNPVYENVAEEVYEFLSRKMERCLRAGMKQDNIIVDPGIGFGKTAEHNMELLRSIPKFRELGRVLIGVSRKSFIGQFSNNEPPQDRLPGSLAAAIHAAQNGADILRVHDVKETRQALAIAAFLG